MRAQLATESWQSLLRGLPVEQAWLVRNRVALVFELLLDELDEQLAEVRREAEHRQLQLRLPLHPSRL